MPKVLTSEGSAAFAALIASAGMTAKVRSLASDIRDACESSDSLDWSEDLASLGITIPSDETEADKVRKSLQSAFGTVATEVSDGKRAARVAILPTGEVAVSFRNVKVRAKS